MKEIKEKILLSIYNCFEDWSRVQPKICDEGCASCCTQNVTVTTAEAAMILSFIAQNNKSQWLAEVLSKRRESDRPAMTTNQFANACLAGDEVDPGAANNFAPCLFLKDGSCQVYVARPFGCRAFISQTTCSAHTPASVSEKYLAAVTTINQIVEHLDQKQHWGHLFDVLTVLSQQPEYSSLQLELDQQLTEGSLIKLLKAQPLGGFLLTEEDIELVQPLLESIFTTKIDHRTIEEILNGKN